MFFIDLMLNVNSIRQCLADFRVYVVIIYCGRDRRPKHVLFNRQKKKTSI